MKCKAYQVAGHIDLEAIPSDHKFREVNLINTGNNKYFVFPYGVIVCWGDGDISDALVLLRDHFRDALTPDKVFKDEFDVKINIDTENIVKDDTIFLSEKDDKIMLALSHPIAQSLRLIHIEEKTLESIKLITHIPEDLAKNGKISKSKKHIAKMQGHLYLLKSEVSLQYSILDKPEFFWENPEFDHYYIRMSNYLELSTRIEVINKKMETIDQILSILSDELNHRHSSKLEVIIILLILIEIVIFFLQDIFKVI